MLHVDRCFTCASAGDVRVSGLDFPVWLSLLGFVYSGYKNNGGEEGGKRSRENLLLSLLRTYKHAAPYCTHGVITLALHASELDDMVLQTDLRSLTLSA